MTGTQAVVVGAVLLTIGLLLWVRAVRKRTDLGTDADRATFATLHTASLAAPHLRDGLTRGGAEKAARHLRALLGTPAVALSDAAATLAWDGAGAHHAPEAVAHARDVMARGRTVVLGPKDVACEDPACP
ncbi:MAG: sensor histidine kinase, partial [Actinomycetes bacterium]